MKQMKLLFSAKTMKAKKTKLTRVGLVYLRLGETVL